MVVLTRPSLALFHRHPVRRFNPLSEVNDEAEEKRETDDGVIATNSRNKRCEPPRLHRRRPPDFE
jgi:hypothetical protein